MVSMQRRAEINALLKQARKDGGRPFVAYIKDGSGGITVVALADQSDFVYKKLKQAEGEILEGLRAKYPQVTRVIVTRVIKDPMAQSAIGLGGRARVFRRENGQRNQLRATDASNRA